MSNIEGRSDIRMDMFLGSNQIYLSLGELSGSIWLGKNAR
jgi:hypothetical protein